MVTGWNLLKNMRVKNPGKIHNLMRNKYDIYSKLLFPKEKIWMHLYVAWLWVIKFAYFFFRHRESAVG